MYNKQFFSNIVNSQKTDNVFKEINYLSWHDGISNIGIICFIIVGLIKILSYLNFKQKVGNNVIRNKRINNIFESCKNELGISKNIKIVMPKKYIPPAIDGIFNVRIILSKEIIKFSDEKIRNIFLHELSHYKRKDNVIYWILSVLTTIYWFNPIVYLLIKSIRNNIEYATDEMAIKEMNEKDRKEYCRTMVNVAEISYTEKVFAIGFLRKNILNKRVNSILNYKNEIKSKNKFKYFITIAMCLFIIIFFTPTIYSKNMDEKIYLKTSRNERIYLNEKYTEIKLDKNEYIFIWNNTNENMMCINLKTGDKIIENYIVIEVKEGEYIYKINDNILNIKVK